MRFGSNARRRQVRMPAVLRTRSKESSIEQKPASRTRTRSRRGKRGPLLLLLLLLLESDDAYDEVGNDYDEYASRAKLATNRPFEIVAGLPASVELPNYNSSLTHPQSIKNSGVLYDSLVSSRRTWVQGEMFELYWRRPKKIVSESTPAATESPTSGTIPLIRDKMQKMCDCVMSGGPHTFKVRLFILKNDKIEQKWQDEHLNFFFLFLEKRKNDAEAKRLRMLLSFSEQYVFFYRFLVFEVNVFLLFPKQKLEQEALNDFSFLLYFFDFLVLFLFVGSPSSSMHDPSYYYLNLNYPQEDPKLNTLMETVAKGLANNSQLEEFKKFIEIAKKRSLEENPVNKRPSVTTTRPAPPSKAKDVAEDHRLNSITLVKSSKTAATEPEPKKADDENAEKQQSKEAKTTAESTQVDQFFLLLLHKEKGVKSEDCVFFLLLQVVGFSFSSFLPIKEDKDMQLTAFQQKYVQGAEIILEYLEFTHSRYYLPKKSVVEFLEDTDEIIISWIVIHNSKEIEKFIWFFYFR